MTHILSEVKIKLFHISNQLLENELDAIEREYSISLGRTHVKRVDSDSEYYPQIDALVR